VYRHVIVPAIRGGATVMDRGAFNAEGECPVSRQSESRGALSAAREYFSWPRTQHGANAQAERPGLIIWLAGRLAGWRMEPPIGHQSRGQCGVRVVQRKVR
jgi:hypothetical protein